MAADPGWPSSDEQPASGPPDALEWAEYLDPDSGYPDGDDAWLARVAGPVAEEYLQEQEAAAGAGAPEAFGAGFTHRDPGAEGGRGFASGGLLDTMEPGPVLAWFVQEAWAKGLTALTDDELIGWLCAARRLSSWTAAMELAAVAELDRRRTAAAEATGDHRGVEHVPDEVAAALTLTGRAAARLMDIAAGAARLPAVQVSLAAGRIDMLRAEVFATELAGLDDVTAAAVAAVMIRDAETMTTGQLRHELRKVVLGVDPAAARKRRERAQKDARVETWSELAGTAALAGRDLPPAEVLAADKQLTADASALKAAGADGSLQYLRARVYLARLAGQPLYTLLPGPPDTSEPSTSEPTPPADGADGPHNGPGGPGGLGWPGGGGLFPAGLKGSVNLTAPLATYLGLTGQPGEVAGYGPLDAAATRDLAAALARTKGNKWCLTLTDPDGSPHRPRLHHHQPRTATGLPVRRTTRHRATRHLTRHRPTPYPPAQRRCWRVAGGDRGPGAGYWGLQS